MQLPLRPWWSLSNVRPLKSQPGFVYVSQVGGDSDEGSADLWFGSLSHLSSLEILGAYRLFVQSHAPCINALNVCVLWHKQTSNSCIFGIMKEKIYSNIVLIWLNMESFIVLFSVRLFIINHTGNKRYFNGGGCCVTHLHFYSRCLFQTHTVKPNLTAISNHQTVRSQTHLFNFSVYWSKYNGFSNIGGGEKKRNKELHFVAVKWSEEFLAYLSSWVWHEIVVNMLLIKFQPPGMCPALSEMRTCPAQHQQPQQQETDCIGHVYEQITPVSVLAVFEQRLVGSCCWVFMNYSSPCQPCRFTFPGNFVFCKVCFLRSVSSCMHWLLRSCYRRKAFLSSCMTNLI